MADNSPRPSPKPGRRAWWFAAGALVASFCAISIVALFSTVTQYDAIARLKLVDPAGAVINPQPTDLYAISIERKSISGPLCQSTENKAVSSTFESYKFDNILGTYVPALFNINQSFFSADTNPQPTLKWDTLVDYMSISEVNIAVENELKSDSNCQTTVESQITQGYAVCAVHKVFANREKTSILAISFDECIVPCPEEQVCPDKIRLSTAEFLPYPIRIKDWLGLINYTKLPN